jgi:hypothetical protein
VTDDKLTDDQLRRAKQALAKAKGVQPENILTRSVYLELAVGKLITHADLDEPDK